MKDINLMESALLRTGAIATLTISALIMAIPAQAKPSANPGHVSGTTRHLPPANALPDISRTLAFENPGECDSASLADFFEGATKSASVVLGPLGRIPVNRSRQAHGSLTQRAVLRAAWNGLTIVALEHITVPDSDNTEVNFYNLVFAEAAAITGPVLGRMGFGVSRVDQEKEIYNPDTMMNPYYISLKRRDSGSMLSCSL